MSVLPDYHIRAAIEDGLLGIDPYLPAYVQPASIDLTLGDRVLLNNHPGPGGVWTEDYWHERQIYGSLAIAPGEFVLAHTAEVIRLPATLAGQLSGRSSVGRRGLAVHVTAGWVDPGFEGQLTLEIVNHAAWEAILRPGERIAQLVLLELTAPCQQPYQGRYQGQRGVVASRDEGKGVQGG